MYSSPSISSGLTVDGDLYKIGAVAKRTGISPECLRAWERRYGLQAADRAGKTRFYSSAQIDRLVAVKALLDQGHPISQVIRFTDAELERRRHPAPQRPTGHLPRIGLVGGQLILTHRNRRLERADIGVEIVAEWASMADLEADKGVLPELDCLVVYVPTLDVQYIENVEQVCPRTRVVVAFRYATAVDLEECRKRALPLLRWPAEWETLLLRVTSATPAVEVAVRRYSDEELVHISLMASRAGCECPRHLAALIGEVNDYEAHARRCGDTDVGIREDHRMIERQVQAARAQLEGSLRHLVEKHGLLAVSN